MFPRTFTPVRRLFAVCVVAFAPVWAAAAETLPTGYRLTRPPMQAMDALKAEVGVPAKLTDDERKLLGKVWERKAAGRPADLTDAEQIDLFLLASGETDLGRRAEYRRKVAELRVACGTQLDGVTKPADRGEKVFRQVRATMPKGYVEGQTRLTTAFDSGSFNCVSVSALLYLVGTHHGLDLRPMRSPGHAYLEWVPEPMGKRSIVEGTTADGFRYVDKMTALDRWLNRKDLELYAGGREIDAAGLAGTIYFNRGLFARNQPTPDYPAAVVLHLIALTLDPADKDATCEVINDLGQWAFTLAVKGPKECEEGLRLIGAARALAPDHPSVRRYEGAVRIMHVAHALDAGNDRETVRRARLAGEQVPTDYRFDTPAAAYAWFAFRIGGGGNWESGLDLLTRGLKAVPEENRKWLLTQRGEYFRQWSAARLENGDLDGSLAVLVRAAKAAPHDPAVLAAIRQHGKAAAKHPLGETHLKKWRDRFPAQAEADTLTAAAGFVG